MARIHLVIPDDDRERYADQARREGLTLSAWLRLAAESRCELWSASDVFKSREEVEDFFRKCDALSGLVPEPDWELQKVAMSDDLIERLPKT